MTAACPANETARLEALWRYRVLDTPPEQPFDDLARVAGSLYHAPIAAVSLVDANRLWFKAKIGFDLVEAPREHAFCAHAILDTKPLVVTDVLADERFAANPFVTGAPGFRFYAGAPLLTSTGHALGTLCVIDLEPRPSPSEAQLDGLAVLAHQVVTQLELRQMTRAALNEAGYLGATDGTLTICAWCKTIADGNGNWCSLEQFIKTRLEVQVSHGMCPCCFAAQTRAIERPQ